MTLARESSPGPCSLTQKATNSASYPRSTRALSTISRRDRPHHFGPYGTEGRPRPCGPARLQMSVTASGWLAGAEGRIPPEVVDHLLKLVDVLPDSHLVGHRVQERLAFADQQDIPGFALELERSAERHNRRKRCRLK